MKTAAIIPAHNEHRHISEVVQQTKKYVDLVIVIDDGSKDDTSELAEKAKADVVLKHIVNMGKGLALKTGIEAAIKKEADLIVTIDADAQHDPADIPQLLEMYNKGGVDIVIGSRPANQHMPFVFKLGNRFLNKVFSLFFNQKINDTQSGFRVFKASAYPKIRWKSTGYAVETEMLANAGRHGLRCAEIPIKTRYVDKYKGTTILDGISIFFKMVIWRLRR